MAGEPIATNLYESKSQQGYFSVLYWTTDQAASVLVYKSLGLLLVRAPEINVVC
jgi:hypothetical protein